MTALNKLELLERLPAVEVGEAAADDMAELRRLSLTTALLLLAEIDHEHEYELCRSAARHLLGEVREPEDLELEE